LKLPFLEGQIGEFELRSYYSDQAAIAATHYNLGLFCAQHQWLTSARTEYTTALWKNPKNPLLHYAIGNVYFLQNNYQKTTESFQEALKLESKFAYISKRLGDTYANQKKTEQALEAYQTYLYSQPDDALVRGLLANMYEQKPDVIRAIAEYKKCLDLDPEYFFALNQLAWIYAERGENLDDALTFAQKVVSIKPASSIIDTLGWVYYKRQEYAKAIEQFKLALLQDPFQPTIKYHLGLAYSQHGDRDLARQTFEEVLELSKNFEHAAEIRQLLDQLTPAGQ
jgi:tetratricopeptide (TPR) repeat protein